MQLIRATAAAVSLPSALVVPDLLNYWPIVAAPPNGGGGACTGNPKIGKLCGLEAVGAIIGIALGGAAVLALATFGIIYVLRGSAQVVVLDDMAWAEKYQVRSRCTVT